MTLTVCRFDEGGMKAMKANLQEEVYRRILAKLDVSLPAHLDIVPLCPKIPPADEMTELKTDPEILQRAVMFRDHLVKPGPSLFFVMPGASIRDGHCQTCGEEVVAGNFGIRCEICIAAARIALDNNREV